jgi:hypothetical protein
VELDKVKMAIEGTKPSSANILPTTTATRPRNIGSILFTFELVGTTGPKTSSPAGKVMKHSTAARKLR